jgi:hypothetical protein
MSRFPRNRRVEGVGDLPAAAQFSVPPVTVTVRLKVFTAVKFVGCSELVSAPTPLIGIAKLTTPL